jgi:hypothetical protein
MDRSSQSSGAFQQNKSKGDYAQSQHHKEKQHTVASSHDAHGPHSNVSAQMLDPKHAGAAHAQREAVQPGHGTTQHSSDAAKRRAQVGW